MNVQNEPQTLSEAIRYYSDEQICIDLLASIRWPDGEIVCAGCGEIGNTLWLSNQKRWKCRGCKKQFSVKVGTVFQDSPIGLDKWMVAVWMLANCRNGVSSYEIKRAIGVSQKCTWHMLHRIRLAMQNENKGPLWGEVEADETFIGGKARNMHKSVHERRISGMGQNFRDKTIVMGVLERGGRVRTQVITDRKNTTLQPIVRKHVAVGSTLYTDEMGGYKGLDDQYLHEIIDHAVEYVNGRVHTNGMENFWSLLKRGLNGTYVAVEPYHLFRYLDEQVFRFNLRKKEYTDALRFKAVLRAIVGRRLTYAELTGKLSPAA